MYIAMKFDIDFFNMLVGCMIQIKRDFSFDAATGAVDGGWDVYC